MLCLVVGLSTPFALNADTSTFSTLHAWIEKSFKLLVKSSISSLLLILDGLLLIR